MTGIIILVTPFLHKKVNHKHFSLELGHFSIGKKNLLMAIVIPPRQNPRAYRVIFANPLKPSHPSCIFGLEAQKSKKIHNRSITESYNLIFLVCLKCIKQRTEFLIPCSMTVKSPSYFKGPLSPYTKK